MINKKTAIEEVIYQHNNHFNKIDFSSWLSRNREQMLKMEAELAQEYASFCVMCDREARPLIHFRDFIKLNRDEKDI